MGLRERKRQRTRETIARSAYKRFHEQGYGETTVEEIAEDADISVRTFYRYFETKDGVLAEGGYTVVDRALERLGTPRRVEALVRAMADAYDELVAKNHFKDFARILRENPGVAASAPVWRERWSSHLAERLAKDDGLESPTLEYRIRSDTAVQVLTTAVDEWLYRSPERSIADLSDETLSLLRSSLDPGTHGEGRS